jgi:hypothetical protein
MREGIVGAVFLLIAATVPAAFAAGDDWSTVVDETWNEPASGWLYDSDTVEAGGRLRLTPATTNVEGVATFLTPFSADRFRASWDFEICGGTGADGIWFLWQKTVNYPRYPVTGARYSVEFDTYCNGSANASEPLEDHVSFSDYCAYIVDGGPHTTYVTSPLPELEDTGVWHTQLEFEAGHLQVWVGRPTGELVKYIDYQIDGYQSFGPGYFGWNAYCGDLTNAHFIDNFVLQVPEPTSALAVGGSFVVLIVRRTRRAPWRRLLQ